jgi:hypothetical protein
MAPGDARYGASAAAVTSLESRIRALPRGTLIATLILLLSAAIAFGFVLQRGGLLLPEASISPSSAPGASPSP